MFVLQKGKCERDSDPRSTCLVETDKGTKVSAYCVDEKPLAREQIC